MDSVVPQVTRPDISGKIARIVKGAVSDDTAAQADAHGVHVIPRGGEPAEQSIAGVSLSRLDRMAGTHTDERTTLDDLKVSIDRLTAVIAAQQIQQTQATLAELKRLQASLGPAATGAATSTNEAAGADAAAPTSSEER